MNRNLSLSTCQEIKIQKIKILTIGDYEVDKEKVLGYGSFAKVYRGKNKDGQDVCIKAMNKYDKKKHHLKMAQNQAKILSDLDHRNICKLKDTFQNQDHFYLITKLYQGPTLGEYLNCKKKLDYDEVQTILTQLIDSLEVLHKKKIMHRDLKPDNIILTFVKQSLKKKPQSVCTTSSSVSFDSNSDKKNSIALIDFGFATKLINGQSTILKQSLGTPSYMAPQLLDNKKYTSKADIWSLGVILHQMIYGKLPWIGRSQKQLLQKIRTQKLKLHSTKQYKINQLFRQILVGSLQPDHQKRISWRELFALNQNLKNGNVFLDFEDKYIEKCQCNIFNLGIF